MPLKSALIELAVQDPTKTARLQIKVYYPLIISILCPSFFFREQIRVISSDWCREQEKVSNRGSNEIILGKLSLTLKSRYKAEN